MNQIDPSHPCDPDNPAERFGQAITEFALILPILLLLIFGIIEFARLFQAYLVVDNAARFGVRYAVTGEYNPAYCVDTDDGPDQYGVDGPCKGAAKTAEEDAARLLSIFTMWCVGFLVRFPSAMGLGKTTPVGSWCRFAAPVRDFIMTQA